MGYLIKEQINEVNDSRIKASLIKDALKIVDKLATLNIYDDIDEIGELIEWATKLKKNRLFKL